MLDVSLLGTGGMMPLPDRFLTSMLLRFNGKLLLVDCGEGTQVTAKMLGWGMKNIDIILITHYHADHIAGLPGMLLSIGNSGRTEKIKIIGPKGLFDIYNGLSVICPELPFEVELIEMPEAEIVNIIEGDFYISAVKLEHRILCYGYSIEIKRKGKFDVEKANKNNVPMEIWGKLQKEEAVCFNGLTYTSDMVLGKERKGIKVTYTTDSRPINKLIDFAKKSDLYICEGMYGENENKEKAYEKKHMIFSEAAEIAKKAEVKELWLTHFSPALSDPFEHIENARCIFKNTSVGETRKTKRISYEN